MRARQAGGGGGGEVRWRISRVCAALARREAPARQVGESTSTRSGCVRPPVRRVCSLEGQGGPGEDSRQRRRAGGAGNGPRESLCRRGGKQRRRPESLLRVCLQREPSGLTTTLASFRCTSWPATTPSESPVHSCSAPSPATPFSVSHTHPRLTCRDAINPISPCAWLAALRVVLGRHDVVPGARARSAAMCHVACCRHCYTM